MKKRNLATAVRSAAGRDKITAVREKDLVLSLGAGVYVGGDGSQPIGGDATCPHVEYPAPA
jgi:hypothetical protein